MFHVCVVIFCRCAEINWIVYSVVFFCPFFFFQLTDLPVKLVGSITATFSNIFIWVRIVCVCVCVFLCLCV